MVQGVYVASDLTGLLRRFLDKEGVRLSRVDAQLAAYPGHGRMPMSDWWSLLESIQSALNLPALGLKIGACVQPQDSGVMGYMVMYCDTVGEALLHFKRYQGLIHNYSEVDIESKGNDVWLSWGVEKGISTQLSDEVFLSGLISFMQQVTSDVSMRPSAVNFIHQVPFGKEHYEALLGCPVEFGCSKVRIAIPVKALSIPINSHNPYLLSLLEKQAAALVDNQSDEFLTVLQKVLVEGIAQGQPTLAFVARQMNISSRTLHRRLQSRSTHFQLILQQTRQRLAEHYLEDLSLSLNEISFLLGYSEQSAFNRAFKKWKSVSPKKYRDAIVITQRK